MSSPVIQADYEQLDAIAARFSQRAEAVTTLHGHVLRSYQALEDGGWIGRGFSAFSTEMQGEIFPALERLSHALDEARAVTLQVSTIIRTAEEEAASLFQCGPHADVPSGGGPPDNGTVDNGRAGDGRGNPWGMLIGGAIGGFIAGPVGTIIGGAIGNMGVGSVVAGIDAARNFFTTDNVIGLGEAFVKQIAETFDDRDGIPLKFSESFKILGYVTMAIDIANIGSAIQNAQDKGREATVQGFGFASKMIGGKIGLWAGVTAGGWVSGAIAGSVAGSVVPGLGTVAGFIVGGLVAFGVSKGFEEAGKWIGNEIYDIYEKKYTAGEYFDYRAESIKKGVNGFIDDFNNKVDSIKGFVTGVLGVP